MAEVDLHYNPYKGTGKAWIQRIEDGKRTSFVDPYNVMKDGYKGTKTYRLKTGTYLFNESGSKSRDSRSVFAVSQSGKIKNFGDSIKKAEEALKREKEWLAEARKAAWHSAERKVKKLKTRNAAGKVFKLKPYHQTILRSTFPRKAISRHVKLGKKKIRLRLKKS
jgi:hypothetical protein